MNADDLYEDNIYGNGNPTYYADEKCEIPYTGHVEVIYNGKLEEEFDIVDGLRNGIQKEYENGILTEIDETRGNRTSGFGVSYYPSGAFKAISITYDDNLISAYFYSEDGHNVKKFGVPERFKDIVKTKPDGIFALVSIADLEKMNEEILKYGHPLNLPKGFEFVVPEK
ncbi:hypothetical protein [Treponema saccharophilum]|uniref:MORN repeat-containing protein n=1 Tax=Treponema saccharophilum DSM 2985 TaxID=907348 RepID=H7ELV7_9SPIR|nr:hypothetical protein [Treponema saccharophilum]EIC01365.1 hypothetical protein TresaDRAFT_1257 [Treponema saccharophilum DSM 2985]BDC97657.1 hypothetical protein TRSA_27560 [Treponema saccharophilum]